MEQVKAPELLSVTPAWVTGSFPISEMGKDDWTLF